MSFYSVYQNINKLLYNRGYEKHPNHKLSENELLQIPKSELTIRASIRPDAKIKNTDIFVFFPDEEKIGIKTLRTYKNDMLTHSVNNTIIVVKDSITPFAKQSIQSEIKEPMVIEIFTEPELYIDISEHSLVPKHELLTKEEKDLVLKKYDIKEKQLPKILISDKISKYYGFKKLDLVKITRLSETGGYYVYYRLVV
jgi:DNA-directed RNA polymerase I, II, and III subunit RPABC1